MDNFPIIAAAACQEARRHKDLMETPHITLPKDFRVESLEHLMPTPSRIKCHFKTKDWASFILYLNRFKDQSTVLFKSPGGVMAVFDYHTKTSPGWCDHRASFMGEIPEDNFPDGVLVLTGDVLHHL